MANIQKIVLQYEADLSKLKKDYDQLEKEMKDVEKTSKKSQQTAQKEIDKTSGRVQSLGGIIKGVGAGIAAAFSVRAVVQFTSEVVKLAAQAQGVKAAFDKLNDPLLLDKLRKATRGTVSDLELMQKAIQAKNFKIPLDLLAKGLDFARRRAKETGESVDFLVDSFVTGIGRRSIMILDNLGISQTELSAKVKETGDFYAGVADIIDTSMAEAGEEIDTVAEKQAQLNATLANTKVQIGEELLPAANAFFQVLADGAESVGLIFEVVNRNLAGEGVLLNDVIRERARLSAARETAAEDVTQLAEANQRLLGIYGDTDERIDALLRQYLSLIDWVGKTSTSVEEGEIRLNALKKAYNDILNPVEETTEALEDQKKKGVDPLIEGLEQLMLILRLQDVDAAQKEFIETIDTLITNSEEAGAKIGDIEERKQEAYEKSLLTAKEAQEEEREQIALTVQARADAAVAVFSAAQSIGNDLGALLGEQAEKSKGLAVFNILLEQAQALARAISQAFALPPPFNFLAAASAVASVTAAFKQVDSIISGAETPKFAEGVIDLHGKGGPKSDAIPALLSRGESVMTAAETSEHKALLQSIRTGNYDEYIAKNHVKPILNSFAENLAATLPLYDDYGIIRAVRGNKTINLSNQTIKKLRQPKQRFH